MCASYDVLCTTCMSARTRAHTHYIYIYILTHILQVDADDVWGWMVYTILVGIFFAFIKSINYRLHKLFGTDPLILKEEETAKEEDKKDDTDETEAAENKDKEKTADDENQGVPEFGIKPYPTKTDEGQTDIDVNVEVHKSASSLNSTIERPSLEVSNETLELSRRSSGSRYASGQSSSPKLESKSLTAATPHETAGVAKAGLVSKKLAFD